MIDYYETKSQPITKVMVWQAFKEVKANTGSCGIDQMSLDDLDKNKSKELYKLWNRLTSGSYFPKPVKQVAIPKKDGGQRMLGIPTVLDRVAQQVVKHHLEKAVEHKFHDSSFGYRPNRNAHQAVKQANYNTFNYNFAIDLDIKGFFDSIDHELLMQAVRHYCQDKWVLMYVERWLKAGVLTEDGKEIDTLTGTPQGGIISPLLANIFLHVVFDNWMAKYHSDKPFERYADDIVVHCKTRRQSVFMLRQIEARMSQCKLQLHAQKTKIVQVRGVSEKKLPKGYDFLGFTIRARPYLPSGNTKVITIPSVFVSKKSKSSIIGKFRDMQIHKKRKTLEELANYLRPTIRGIINYYHKFSKGDMREVWNQLNHRLLKWVKWEKGLYKKASVRYLKSRYSQTPQLFPHWLLVRP